MKITIESTPNTRRIDGVECRVWKGTTEKGNKCTVYVANTVGDPAYTAEFMRAVPNHIIREWNQCSE